MTLTSLQLEHSESGVTHTEKTTHDPQLSNYQRYLDHPHLFDKNPRCATRYKREKVYDVRDMTSSVKTSVSYCHDRGCGYPLCMHDRFVRARRSIAPYFACIKKTRHTTFTAKNCVPSKRNKYLFKRDVKRLLRLLSRDPHNPRTTLCKTLHKHHVNVPHSVNKIINIVVFEYKIQENGDMHPHVHIANNFSYLHDVVSDIWDEILGYHGICWVNLYSKKANMIRYFAKRIAWAGLHVDDDREDIFSAKFIGDKSYHDLISGSRLFFAQGDFESFRLSYFLDVLEIAEHLECLRFRKIMFSQGDCEKSGELPPPFEDSNLISRLVLQQIRELGYRSESHFIKSAHKEYMAAWLKSHLNEEDLEELECCSRAVQTVLSTPRFVPQIDSKAFWNRYNAYMTKLAPAEHVGGENY